MKFRKTSYKRSNLCLKKTFTYHIQKIFLSQQQQQQQQQQILSSQVTTFLPQWLNPFHSNSNIRSSSSSRLYMPETVNPFSSMTVFLLEGVNPFFPDNCSLGQVCTISFSAVVFTYLRWTIRSYFAVNVSHLIQSTGESKIIG